MQITATLAALLIVGASAFVVPHTPVGGGLATSSKGLIARDAFWNRGQALEEVIVFDEAAEQQALAANAEAEAEAEAEGARVAEYEELNALDKLQVAAPMPLCPAFYPPWPLPSSQVDWGIKAAPGEPEIDLKAKIKSLGVAGVIAYTLTELGFWGVSIPLGVLVEHQATGQWLDLTTPEGQQKVAAFSFSLLAVLRLLIPFRLALGIALAPWCDENIIQRFGIKEAEAEEA
ncbi:unnamed protein product [Chrysoparadoxa australica]